MKKLILSFSVALCLSNLLFGQVMILNEDFQSGIPSNWTMINDTNTVDTTVIDFSDAWISLIDPLTNANFVVGSTSYFEDQTNPASRWLITPSVALGAYGNTLTWKARAHDPSYLDGYLVLLSNTDNQATSFNDTIGYIIQEHNDWTTRTIDLSDSIYLNQDVYIAFVNNSLDKFKLYLDDVQLEINNPLAIEQSSMIDFGVFPNPISSIGTIQSAEPVLSYVVLTMDGKELLSKRNNSLLDVSELAPGMYVLKIETTNGIGNKTILKN